MSIDTYPQVDPAITQAFMGRVLGDSSACMVTAMAALGDRLGLFKALATHGPGTADEVAAQSGTQPRYVREWLGGMAAAGYIRYEPASEQFSLPAEHAAVLAEEGGPFFVGAAFQLTMPQTPAVRQGRGRIQIRRRSRRARICGGSMGGPGALQRRLGRAPADPGVGAGH
jgi:hypothetical protein